MDTNDPRYYDPETGKPLLDEWIEVIGQSDTESTVMELARLQRERDEARVEVEAVRGQRWNLTVAARELESTLATERAAREKAEAESATLRAELRTARRRDVVMRMGVIPAPAPLESAPWTIGVVSTWVRCNAQLGPLVDAGIHKATYGSPGAALDAAWEALHDAGLVEDEDHE